MRLRILGKCWQLRFAPNMSNRGDCDPPTKPSKEIRIASNLHGEELTEVLLHEILHAANWHLDEEFVAQFAHDAARALTRLGFTHAGKVQ